MEHLLLVIIGILLLIIFVLLAKVYFLRKSAQEIAENAKIAEIKYTIYLFIFIGSFLIYPQPSESCSMDQGCCLNP